MASPRWVHPKLAAGFVKREGPLEAQGRFVDGNWVRFVRGNPEKIKGYSKLTSSTFLGICRGSHTWNDLSSATQMAIGTNRKLYYVDPSFTLQNITPYDPAAGVALNNVLSTTIGTPTVKVTHTAHGKTVGQGLSLSATVGGITLAGDYTITTVVDANNYEITAASNAGSTVTNGGGAITIYYEIAVGAVDPAGGFGFGTDVYGTGTYGTARATSNIVYDPRYWALDNFGKLLLAAPNNGPLYKFDPTITVVHATLAAPVSGPGGMRYMFVTPERFVVALGASPDTTTAVDNMLVRWCEQGDYSDWVPGIAKTANSRRMQVGKKLIAGTSTGTQLSLFWSDTALYLLQYTGSSLVFDTRVAGINCGLIGPMAFCLAGPVAYWMSPGGFYRYSGTVDRVPNSEDISEWIFDQTRASYGVKNVCFYNQRFNEVWFLFVPTGQTEPTLYAMVNLDDFSWVHGSLTRTSHTAFDGGDNRPILAGTDGYLYLHEDGLNGDGAAINAWLQTGYTEIEDGNWSYDISGWRSDMGRQTGAVTIDFTAYDESGGEASIDTASITATPGTGQNDLRIAGRLISFLLRSNVTGGDFRLGRFSVEILKSARRR